MNPTPSNIVSDRKQNSYETGSELHEHMRTALRRLYPADILPLLVSIYVVKFPLFVKVKQKALSSLNELFHEILS